MSENTAGTSTSLLKSLSSEVGRLKSTLSNISDEIQKFIPTKLSQLQNDNNTVIDAGYGEFKNQTTIALQTLQEELPTYAKNDVVVEALKGKQDSLTAGLGISITESNRIEVDPSDVDLGSRLAENEKLAGAMTSAAKQPCIDMWNTRCVAASTNNSNAIGRNTFGRYNEETGYFELNGITDITCAQAMEIMRVPDVAAGDGNNTTLSYSRARTLFPIMMDFGASLHGICSYMPNLEVVRFGNYYIVNNGTDPDTTPMTAYSTRGMFAQCPKLREVKGVLWLQPNDEMNVHLYSALDRSARLETIWLQGVCLNMSLKACAALRYECIAYMVEHAANTKAITITLHPDAYARITDGLIAEAAEKQITFATTS